MARPRITQGMSMEEWKSFLVLWRLYKVEADVSEEEWDVQLILCCEKKLAGQVYRADPSIVTKPEVGQLESIQALAVIPSQEVGGQPQGLVRQKQVKVPPVTPPKVPPGRQNAKVPKYHNATKRPPKGHM